MTRPIVDVWPELGTTVTLASSFVITAAGAQALLTDEIANLLMARRLLTWDPTLLNPNPSPIPPAAGGTGLSVAVATDLLPLVGASNGQVVALREYASAAGGGGGHFCWDASSSAAVDSGLVFGSFPTGRWLRLGAEGAVNVRWFGAKGDAVTDDTAAIQAACAVAAGGSVFIPHGEFLITNAITLPEATRMEGEGWGSIIHQSVVDKNGLIVSSGCKVSNLHLVGPNNATVTVDTANIGIYGVSASAVTISGNYIERFALGGVALSASLDVVIEGNTCFRNPRGSIGGGVDISIGAMSGRCRIQGNHCLSNNDMGINVDALGSVNDVMIDGNVCVTLDPATCTLGGTWAELSSGVQRRHGILIGYNNNATGPRSIVSNNICRNTVWTGIYKHGASAGPITVTGNTCSRNGLDVDAGAGIGAGIYLEQSGGEVVSHNTVSDYMDSTTQAIFIQTAQSAAATKPTIVSNNSIQTSAGGGFTLAALSTLVTLDGNTVSGAALNDIYIVCTPGQVGVGEHTIVNNRFVRSNTTSVSIYADTQSSARPLVISGNKLKGFDGSVGTTDNVAIVVRHARADISVSRNSISGFGYAFRSDAYWTGRLTPTFEGNEISGCLNGFAISSLTGGSVPLVNNIFSGVTNQSVASPSIGGGACGLPCGLQGSAYVFYGTAAPVANTWAVGDRMVRSVPVVGQPKSWVCTVAGTPGTWVSEGSL